MHSPGERLRTPVLVGLGLVACATLAFEVFLTRLLAYAVPTLLIYVVLGVAMTGFGMASTLLAFRERPDDLAAPMSKWAAGFSIGLVLCSAAFVRFAPAAASSPKLAFVLALLLTLPFFAAGSVITLALSNAGGDVRRVYSVDLLGSGIGCVLPFLFLRPLGGPAFIGACAVLASVASVVLAFATPSRGRWTLPAIGAVVGLLALFEGDALFPVTPEPLGQVAIIESAAKAAGYRVERIFDRWNVTGRVEHFEFHGVPGGPEPYPFRFYAQDNTAGAVMASWDGRDVAAAPPGSPSPSPVPSMCSDTLYGQAYFEPRRRVLVIGVGGGADVECALYERAEHVDAVEINPDTIAAIRGPMNDFVGNIGQDARVRYYVRDGRSFVHSAPARSYDLIQLSGVDTKQYLASGALAMSENLLYTKEAFVDYLTHVAPSGVVSVLYFGEPAALRLLDTMTRALADTGVADPSRHLLIVENGYVYGLIATPEPLDDARIRAFRARFWFTDRPFVGFHAVFLDAFGYTSAIRPDLLYAPGEARNPLFSSLIELARDGRQSDFEDAYVADVRPVSDDRPFFFDTTRYDRPGYAFAPHVVVLEATLWSVIGLAALFVLAPVWRLRRGVPAARMQLAALYFSSVGLAFLFVEVWLLHRFAMFLGHQTLSLGVVLATLLVSTGAGSLLAGRREPDPIRRVVRAVVVLLVLLGVFFFAGTRLLDHAWRLGLSARVILSVLGISPLGFAMGVCFPSGLEWFGRAHARALPWAVGINFFASVLATVAIVPLALFMGYDRLLAFGAGLYLLAGITASVVRYAAE